jgi:hypothetical protein
MGSTLRQSVTSDMLVMWDLVGDTARQSGSPLRTPPNRLNRRFSPYRMTLCGSVVALPYRMVPVS